MPSLKDIRRRIASVKNTQKITRAMKLVSTAKLKRAQDAMNALKPYAAKHYELLSSLVSQLGSEASHPLMQQHLECRRVGVFALSSDRGMCGGFNSQIEKRLAAYRKERDGVEVIVYPLGRRITKFANRTFTVPEAFGDLAKAANTDTVRHITETIVNAFVNDELDEAVLLFNSFKSVINQEAMLRPLLPVSAEVDDEAETVLADLIYEPDQESLLAYVVPRYLEVQVRQVILESIAGEHAARMNAMTSATDNANDMIKALTLQANRARQAAITKELMEIIGGAEAL